VTNAKRVTDCDQGCAEFGPFTRLLVAMGVVFVILIAGTVTCLVVRTTACGCRKLQLDC
jgi:hypothetical protein